jgi:hypothetical protein
MEKDSFALPLLLETPFASYTILFLSTSVTMELTFHQKRRERSSGVLYYTPSSILCVPSTSYQEQKTFRTTLKLHFNGIKLLLNRYIKPSHLREESAQQEKIEPFELILSSC